MVSEVKAKINAVGSRHSIYLKKDLVKDSSFPFKVGEPLKITIQGDKLVIERDKQ
jgi:hypothetical protein